MTDRNGFAFAFFDVDDTLISVKSMFSFQDFWYRRTGDEEGRAAFESEMRALLKDPNASWEAANRRYYAHFAGRKVADVEACGRDWFAELEASVKGLFLDAVVHRLRAHRDRGEEPVFVSGSFPAVLAPVADRLGVSHMLAIRMAESDGVYTGEILPPQTIGDGKAAAVQAFLDERGIDPERCHAYGDDISDVPMLSLVGYPTVIRGGRAAMEVHARNEGWPIIDPREGALVS